MVTIATVRLLALSLPETEEKPHFDKPSFRVGKKIFAVIHADKKLVMVKLSLIDQSVFCTYDPSVVYPVRGAWGRQGATFIELVRIRKSVLKDAMAAAWCNGATPALRKKYPAISPGSAL